ncbi:MAG: tripartite tricarboxylate transporter permease, partial [Rhodococcus sp. (in: high G+C Gram-positive bacteria)]
APVLIAVILGPLAEESLRRALAVREGDPSFLVGSAITIVLYALMIIAVVFSIVSKVRARKTADF